MQIGLDPYVLLDPYFFFLKEITSDTKKINFKNCWHNISNEVRKIKLNNMQIGIRSICFFLFLTETMSFTKTLSFLFLNETNFYLAN